MSVAKTAETEALWRAYGESRRSVPGDYVVAVDEAFAWEEGEGDRSCDWWLDDIDAISPDKPLGRVRDG